MKYVIRTLAVLAYLASATLAQAGFIINSFQIAILPATISLVGCTTSTTDTNIHTFTDHATGTAGTRKTIVAVAAVDSATNFSTSTVTVGGAGATEIVDSANASSLVQSSIYIIDNPSGTTATIVVTMSETTDNAAVCVWAAYNIQSETATATATEFQDASAAITLSLDVPTDGIAIGMTSVNLGTATHTWTGLTESNDTQVSGEMSYSGADTATAGTPLAVTADPTGTADGIGVSASFR